MEDLPRDALRAILETNLLGPHDLARRLIPAMRAVGRGRIVNCSSVLGVVALPWRGAYNASKFALEGLTDTLRLELRGTGVHVALIEPGPIATPFRRKSIPHFERWIDWRASALAARYEAELIPRLHAPEARVPGQRDVAAVARPPDPCRGVPAPARPLPRDAPGAFCRGATPPDADLLARRPCCRASRRGSGGTRAPGGGVGAEPPALSRGTSP